MLRLALRENWGAAEGALASPICDRSLPLCGRGAPVSDRTLPVSGWALLKIYLQCLGVRLETAAGAERRRGGAGPAEGVTLSIGGRPVSVPGGGPDSPFRLARGGDGYELHGEDGLVLPVELPALSYPRGRRTAAGTPFGRLALLHGTDCLASTVLQRCAYWGRPEACAFCAIGETLARDATEAVKDPEELAEIAEFAAGELGVRHLTLTSGSTRGRRREVAHLAAVCRAVKARCSVAIQVQTLPLEEADLEYLHAFGADGIGVHLESLDDQVLVRVAPEKARLGWEGYLEAWRRAVKVFGRGQVSTYLIVGLGEKGLDRERLRRLTDAGVYPHVVPLRPSPGSRLQGLKPPCPEVMLEAYLTAAEAVREAGLSAGEIKAGCGRCPACSALPDLESEL